MRTAALWLSPAVAAVLSLSFSSTVLAEADSQHCEHKHGQPMSRMQPHGPMHQNMSPEQRRQQHEQHIQAMDSNHDGVISVDEMLSQHQDKMHNKAKQKLQAADLNKDGKTSTEELLQHHQQRMQMHRKHPPQGPHKAEQPQNSAERFY